MNSRQFAYREMRGLAILFGGHEWPRKSSTISNLKYDPRNARRHTPRNVGMVEHSIQRDGFGRSILVANDGTIIAGNATVKLPRLPVLRTSSWWRAMEEHHRRQRTDIEPGSPEFTALAISDNRAAELAEWDAGVPLARGRRR